MDPWVNLAIEEYCFRNLDFDDDYLFLYVNRPSVIIGKHQNAWEEVDLDYIRQFHIPLVRRLSGGGAVYHDLGNINFCHFTKQESGKLLNYATFVEPVLNMLRHLGIPGELKENGIFVGNKKISGNSQHADTKKMFSHGTLLLDCDLGALQGVLNPKPDQYKSQGIKSVQSDVANIADYLSRPAEVVSTMELLQECYSELYGKIEEFDLSDQDWAKINQLSQTKYNSWDWNFGKSPKFVFQQYFDLNYTKITAQLYVEKGIVIDIKVDRGDGSGDGGAGQLNNFIGKRFTPSLLTECFLPREAK